MKEICEAIRCVENIEDMKKPLLERLWREFSEGKQKWRWDLVQQHKNLWIFKNPTTKTKRRCWCNSNIH